ncbi:YT521-B-like domain-containing protein [Hypoxylon crocopeplum]|nr:YT521-B-like domain-containing protein [Hypoxylon crocopeplum]
MESHQNSSGASSPGRICETDKPNDESVLLPGVQDWLKLTNWHDLQYRQEMLTQYRSDNLEEQKSGDQLGATTNMNLDFTQPTDNQSAGSTQAHLATTQHGAQHRRGSGSSGDRLSLVRKRPVSPDRHRRDEFDGYRDRDYPRTYHGSRGERASPSRFQPYPASRPRGHHGHVKDNSRDPYETREESKGGLMVDYQDKGREMSILRCPKAFHPGDTDKVRFFVMRSYSWAHVYNAQENGLWATQLHHAPTLSDAFKTCKYVVLFFAVNKSRSIQGYALMQSLPSVDNNHPAWWYDITWKISQPFKVDWLSTSTISIKYVQHLSNSLNENLSVTRSRDGSEIDARAGRQMLAILESHSIDHYKRAMRIGSGRADATRSKDRN